MAHTVKNLWLKEWQKSSSSMILIDTYCRVMHHSKSIILKMNEMKKGFVKKIKFKIKLGLKNMLSSSRKRQLDA